MGLCPQGASAATWRPPGWPVSPMQQPKTIYPPAIPQEGFGPRGLEGTKVPAVPEPLPTIGMMLVVGGVYDGPGARLRPTHRLPLSTGSASLLYQTPADQDALSGPPAGTGRRPDLGPPLYPQTSPHTNPCATRDQAEACLGDNSCT